MAIFKPVKQDPAAPQMAAKRTAEASCAAKRDRVVVFDLELTDGDFGTSKSQIIEVGAVEVPS